MHLLEATMAECFLSQYKRLLCDVAGEKLAGTEAWEKARDRLYGEGLHETLPMEGYDEAFVEAVRGAIHGPFIYAKRYRQGYALHDRRGAWHCVTALTTPLEELVPDWILIETAILPFEGRMVCDGLVEDLGVTFGRNLIHQMIQELKVERAGWSSRRSTKKPVGQKPEAAQSSRNQASKENKQVPGPRKHDVNEVWIAFQINEAPIRTEQDGDVNVACLMDAASFRILGMEVYPAGLAEVPAEVAGDLMSMAEDEAGVFPRKLWLSSELRAGQFVKFAQRHGIDVEHVPDKELAPFLLEARESFRQDVELE